MTEQDLLEYIKARPNGATTLDVMGHFKVKSKDITSGRLSRLASYGKLTKEKYEACHFDHGHGRSRALTYYYWHRWYVK